MAQENYLEKVANAGSGIQYGGAGGTVISGMALSEIGVIVGIVIAIFGFIVNWYYKHLSYKLQLKKLNSKDIDNE